MANIQSAEKQNRKMIKNRTCDKTTREFEAFVRRKFQNSFGKVG